MSSPKAIGATTHILKRILEECVSDASISSLAAKVSTDPLDKVETNISATDNLLNLYLYLVKENSGWRNMDLASRDHSGNRVSNPFLALDLYYVLSAHGAEKLNGDLILGYGMIALHDNPIIGREFIATELAKNSAKILKDSDLSNQIEQIKITPEIIDSEEISRLWTMFGAKHRQSAYYKVSVVLMKKEKTFKEALPVKEPLVYVNPIKQPAITNMSAEVSQRAIPNYSNDKIFMAGDNLLLEGVDLKGEKTKISLNGTKGIDATVLSNNELKITLPVDLKSGVQTVQVTHELMLGKPPQPHEGINSNLSAIVLSPVLTNQSFTGGKIKAKVKPAIPPESSYVIILNRLLVIPADTPKDYSFTFKNKKKVANNFVETEDIDEAITIEKGNYLVRIRINNATSPLFDDFLGPAIVKP